MKYQKSDILLLIENSYYQPSASYVVTSTALQEKVNKEDLVVFPLTDLSNVVYTHSQAKSLVAYYSQLSPQDKRQTKDFLLSYLVPPKNNTSAKTVILTLVHINAFEEVLENIISNCKSAESKTFYNEVLFVLSEVLCFEWQIVNEATLQKFYDWVRDVLLQKNKLGKSIMPYSRLNQDIIRTLSKLRMQLNIILSFQLKDRIFVGTSAEITTDERALKEEFKKFNFPSDLTETLEKIEYVLATAGDNFDYKSCMDLIRSFSERLFQHVCISINEDEGSKVNVIDSEEVTSFLVKHKLISINQGNILVAFRHFLSNDGVHRLKSRSDDARLSRNIMIELALYLMLRLQDRLS